MTKQRENHREDVIGRANVETTPELAAYYGDLDRYSARCGIRSSTTPRRMTHE